MKSSDTINQNAVSSPVPEFKPAENAVPEVKGLDTSNETVANCFLVKIQDLCIMW